MAKKKYYAIAAGRTPGIYDDWPEAQAQVRGFAGAVFKGFPTRKAAEDWLKNPQINRRRTTTARPGTSGKAGGGPPRPREGEITIYTDGGSINNPGPGGYGVVIINGPERQEFSGGFRLTTNNRMELMGCLVALRKLKATSLPINLYSDSSYVVNGIKKGWAKGWRRRDWRKSDGQPAMNPDLWAELLELTEGLNITFHWVRGHAGNPLNERCDELAVKAARGRNLAEDHGYQILPPDQRPKNPQAIS